MDIKRGVFTWGIVTLAVLSASFCLAEKPSKATVIAPPVGLLGGQQMLELLVRVVDAEGEPVINAKVTPWALRSSQGHGHWPKGDKRAGVGPQDVYTGEDGVATILYPQYRDFEEQIRVTSVSLFVDHPKFAYVNRLHIDVPLETVGPHEVQLTEGAPVEVRPLIDGESADLGDVFALWSDGRSWLPGVMPEKLDDGSLRIPAMSLGENSVLLVKLAGDQATHFSDIVDLNLVVGEQKKIDVELKPALQIEGVLSDNVPRPVQGGRIKVQTLPPAGVGGYRVRWFTWAPIRPDGTFTVDGWPGGERVQLIALCDGYIAASGEAPDVVENPRDPEKDPFSRPQDFDSNQAEQIEVLMTPLVKCVVTAIDENGEPVAGVKVMSWPNVGWWNAGSQIYCHPLVRSERLLRSRKYQNAVDESFPMPFQGETDTDGKVTLKLPAKTKRLSASSDTHELSAFLGSRHLKIDLTDGETTEVVLRLQPRGTEKLGEWDKLAGVVFGCSTREGRRICALPGVRKQMDEFIKRFREAKNQRDPQLLSEAYSAVADAFVGAGDDVEAAKWRAKAAEQTAKLNRVEK